MKSIQELLDVWAAGDPSPRGEGTVKLITLRLPDEARETPQTVRVTRDEGLVGDRWVNKGKTGRQVTLMRWAVASLIAGPSPIEATGDNFIVDLDLSEDALPVGTRLRAGTVLLEVTEKPHLGCEKFSRRFGPDALRFVNDEERRPLRLRGVNCRVVEDGEVRVGDAIAVV